MTEATSIGHNLWRFFAPPSLAGSERRLSENGGKPPREQAQSAGSALVNAPIWGSDSESRITA